MKPFALQNILRNVSLHLPEGYGLVADININNIHLYRVSQEECAILRRVFLMLNYTDITQNTYIQS